MRAWRVFLTIAALAAAATADYPYENIPGWPWS